MLMKSPAQRRKASLTNLELARAAIAAAPEGIDRNGPPPLLVAEPEKVLDGYLSIQLFAQACGVMPRTVGVWMAAPNGLPHIKLGRRIIINLADGREWIAAKTKQNNPPIKRTQRAKHGVWIAASKTRL